MIRAWKLRNFKSVRTSMKQLEFGEITILAGANSSGKSTLIQSILLLAQTLTNRDDYDPLLLNGELVSLGTASDLWNAGDTNEELCIEFIIDAPNTKGSQIFFELCFRPDFADLSNTKVMLSRGHYAWADADDDEFSDESLIIETNGTVHQIVGETEILVEQWNQELAGQRLTPIKTREGVEIKITDFLPDAFYYTISREREGITPRNLIIKPLQNLNAPPIGGAFLSPELTYDLYTAIDEYGFPYDGKLPPYQDGLSLEHEQYVGWVDSLNPAQIRRLQSHFDNKLDYTPEESSGWHRSEFVKKIANELYYFFSEKIRYLSANRIPPTALFDLSPNDILSDVGSDGHNVAVALAEYGNRDIRFWHPKDKKFKKATLLEVVEIWLKYFDLIEKLEPKRSGKLGTLLNLKTDGLDRSLDLTSIGFGTSQILPIIVQGLLCSEGCVFIVEQPEVHLHPKLQSRLAYFFYALTTVGVQCFIETHSEHIINQLRLLVAYDDDIDPIKVKESVKIYFATKDKKKGTTFSEVRINHAGMIEEWPKDFMDESQNFAEKILEAAEKRAKAKG